MSWQQDAKEAAEAFGVTVLVGVRLNGTWFAHADGIEWDGSGPGSAVWSVLRTLRERAEREARLARVEAERLERQLAYLSSTARSDV